MHLDVQNCHFTQGAQPQHNTILTLPNLMTGRKPMKPDSLAQKAAVLWDRTTDSFSNFIIAILALLFLIGGISLTVIAIKSIDFDNNCVATIGTLERTYTKRTRKIFFVDYLVKYSFQFRGQTYYGKDELNHEPLQISTEVFFLANDPSNNRLERGKAKFEFFLSIFSLLMSWYFFNIFKKHTLKSKPSNPT